MTITEKPKMKVIVEGREVEIEVDSQAYKILKNAELKQREERYAGERDTFVDAAITVLNEQTSGFEEAIEDMTIVYNCSTGDAQLVRTELVGIKQRPARKAAGS